MIAAPLGLLAVVLLAMQYVTMAKFAVLPPSLSFHSFGEFVDITSTHVSLGADDLVLLCLCLGCVARIIQVEVRQAGVTAALSWLAGSDRRTVLGLLLLSLVAVRYYFSTGMFAWAADSPQHIAYTNLVAEAFRGGHLSWWTWYLGTGSPFLQFYGFLFFFLAGAMGVLLPTTVALKLTLGLLHAFSGLGVYALLRGARRRRLAALVGGLAYVLCFWHTQQVLIMGRLPLALVYALLPWVLAGFEHATAGERMRWHAALLAGCALGAVVLTHPGYGIWSCLFATLYIGLRGVSNRQGATRIGLGMAGILMPAILVGSALLVPMWLERHATGLTAAFSLEGVPDPAWWSLLDWSNFRFFLFPPDAASYNWYGGYLGVSLVGLAACGLAGRRRLRQAAVPAGLCLGLALTLALAWSSPLVQAVPGTFLLAGGRYLLFVTLFLAVGVGHGVHVLQLRFRRHGHRVATLALGVVLLDLGPTTFQQPYARPAARGPGGFLASDFDGLRHASAGFVEQGQVPSYRTLLAHGQTNRYLATGLLYDQARVPIADGPHPGELAAVFDFVQPLRNYVVWWAQQNQGAVSIDDEVVRAGLRLLNVRFLLTGQSRADGLHLTTLEQPHSTPILAAGTIESFDAFLQREPQVAALIDTQASERVGRIVQTMALIRGMQVDSVRAASQAFFIRHLRARVDLGTDPTVVVKRHAVTTQQVELEVELSEPAFVRLAYGYWPWMDVMVDGVRAVPMETEGRFIALQLDTGAHLILLQPRLSPLRVVLLSLALLVTLAAAYYWIRMRHAPSATESQ